MEGIILILGIKPYNFTNEQTGQVISGTKVSYITKRKTSEGHLPIQNSVDDYLADKITTYPALYRVEYEVVPGKSNKASLAMADFELIQEVDLKSLFEY